MKQFLVTVAWEEVMALPQEVLSRWNWPFCHQDLAETPKSTELRFDEGFSNFTYNNIFCSTLMLNLNTYCNILRYSSYIWKESHQNFRLYLLRVDLDFRIRPGIVGLLSEPNQFLELDHLKRQWSIAFFKDGSRLKNLLRLVNL